MEINSPVFANNEQISQKYTCDGEGINPPLVFSDIPNGAMSLALIMDDPDAPAGTFVHWLLWNLSPQTDRINEDSIPNAIIGVNNAGQNSYIPPCPPSGTHRYFFRLYALDALINLEADANKNQLEQAMQGHILDQAELIGLYGRVKE